MQNICSYYFKYENIKYFQQPILNTRRYISKSLTLIRNCKTAVTAIMGTHLRPFGSPPFRGTVYHVALLPVCGRGLWTHVVRHDSCVPFGHLVYAVDFAHLKSDAAALRTRLEIANVPSGWAGLVVARLRQYFGLIVSGTQVRGDDFLVLFAYAQHQRFLYAYTPTQK